ncbi:hypothetical protein HK405_015904, partial [Cladochytrium tenue]
MRRIAFDGLGAAVPFSDLLLADVLTSYSRVLGDLHLAVADLLHVEPSDLGAALDDAEVRRRRPAWSAMMLAFHYLGPILVCLPFLFRLRQCVAEYRQAATAAARRRHTLNALKYASGLPVVFTSLLVNRARAAAADGEAYDTGAGGGWLAPRAAVVLWMIASLVNSMYSFYWDVVVDWQLPLSARALVRLSMAGMGGAKTRRAMAYAALGGSGGYGDSDVGSDDDNGGGAGGDSDDGVGGSGGRVKIRLQQVGGGAAGVGGRRRRPTARVFSGQQQRRLQFRPRWVYGAAVAADLVLRLAWAPRAALVWQTLGGGAGASAAAAVSAGLRLTAAGWVAVDLALKVAELVRRWGWMYLRVEREW